MCRINKMNDIGAPSHVNQQPGFNDWVQQRYIIMTLSEDRRTSL